MILRDITQKEWKEYEWAEVSEFGSEHPIFIKGIKKTQPPNDGYMYRECTKIGDAEQKWERLHTIQEE